jgi:HEAT repeat protein
MIPARVDASPRMSGITLLFILVSGISLFDQLKNIFSSRDSIPGMKAARDVRGLIRLLKHRDLDVQYGAAEALGEIGDSGAVEPLIAALKNDEYVGVRWKAAEALSKIGAPSVEALIGALRHPDDDVRWKAAIALGEIGDPRAIGPLIILLCDEDRFVKSHAALALGAIGEPAVNPLLRALREGDGNLRWGAAIALGKIRDPRAIEPLIRALADKYENVRAESATALAAMGKPALEPLLRFLTFSDGPTRLEVVTALGELHDTDAIQPLIQFLENADEDERKAIADALDAILIPTVEPLVRKLRNGPHQKNEKTRSGYNDEGEG